MPLEWAIGATAFNAGSWQLIRSRNPARRYLIVSGGLNNDDWGLWPQIMFQQGGIQPIQGAGSVQLYRATLGELVGEDWYVYPFVAMSLIWIDAWDS